MFTVGFFFSTFQSIVFESLLEALITVVASIIMVVDALLFHNHGGVVTDASNSTVSSSIVNSFSSGFPLLSGEEFTLDSLTFDYSQLSFLGKQSETNSFSSRALITLLGNNTDTGSSGDDILLNSDSSTLRQNIVLYIILIFIMAFVIAAGVEETMKHFAVHCCKFPKAIKDPRTVFVYLLTAAVGFETSENIEYVFGATGARDKMTALIGELIVLGMRVCMPIHAICSVLQTVEYSKVIQGTAKSNHTFFVSLFSIIHVFHVFIRVFNFY